VGVVDGLTKHKLALARIAVDVFSIVSFTLPISFAVALIVDATNVLFRSITGRPLIALFAIVDAELAVVCAVLAVVCAVLAVVCAELAVVNAVVAVLTAASEDAIIGSTKRLNTLFITV
jgi:hypothetical protein